MLHRIREVMLAARGDFKLSAGAESLVADALDVARRAWPGVQIDTDGFSAHVARHAPLSDTSAMCLEGMHLSDMALAFAALSRCTVAARAIEELYIQRVGEYVVRTTVDRDVVEETKQQMRTLLLVGLVGTANEESSHAAAGKSEPRMAEYSGKGALGGWLRVMAVRTTLNVLRARKPTSELTADNSPAAPSVSDPQLAYLRAHDRGVFSDAFQQALASLDETSRTMLKLHYLQGMTMSQLATVFQTSRSTVARQIAEVRERILELTSDGLRRSGMSPSVIENMVHQAASELDFTIAKLLK